MPSLANQIVNPPAQTPWLDVRVESRFDPTRPLPGSSPSIRGQGVLIGYAFAMPRAHLSLRAGYRSGLPWDFSDDMRLEETLVFSSGGTVRVSAGTVTWFQFDVQSFRELAGSRWAQLDAVPGLRVRPRWRLPLELGVGALVSLKRQETENSQRRFALLFQIRSDG